MCDCNCICKKETTQLPDVPNIPDMLYSDEVLNFLRTLTPDNKQYLTWLDLFFEYFGEGIENSNWTTIPIIL